ncbi:MAG TPA: Glu/Leu/Phe/Val dehydrogenase dimerization domain-containing protein [Longimicrobium sp.]|nr:Glu/Leu/Phe/Val dehydrogenase dimerization domain-containing protein [Longimicrobium sp.]
MSPAAAPAAPRVSTDPAWRRYGEYLRRPPEIVMEWSDPETEARGWLVINSLRGGAAGGGTRMRAGLTRREVTYLAKTMELKFAFSGPPIGGAKSGIDFDPTDPRRDGVLRRWFRAAAPFLARCYGTGGDLNVDEVRDVIPCCEEIGLSHPQEGVVRGHLRRDLRSTLGALDEGVRAAVDGPDGVAGSGLSVADLVTGYGLARSIIRFHEEQGRDVAGRRVLVEGFGAVGGPCALYLARAGARIVGVSDRDKALLDADGLDAAETERLLRARVDKCLPEGDPRLVRGRERGRFWKTEADVFVAAAASETLDEAALDRLGRAGVSLIACGANQPFREQRMGATRVQRMADRRFTVIPDVIGNCGMARAFSFLMADGFDGDTRALFAAVDRTITDALHEVLDRAGGRPTGLLGAAFDYAIDLVSTP